MEVTRHWLYQMPRIRQISSWFSAKCASPRKALITGSLSQGRTWRSYCIETQHHEQGGGNSTKEITVLKKLRSMVNTDVEMKGEHIDMHPCSPFHASYWNACSRRFIAGLLGHEVTGPAS